MSRPGWLVHAEHEARDKAEREGIDDPRPDRDQPTSDGETCAHGCQCAACRAIARDIRERWGA